MAINLRDLTELSRNIENASVSPETGESFRYKITNDGAQNLARRDLEYIKRLAGEKSNNTNIPTPPRFFSYNAPVTSSQVVPSTNTVDPGVVIQNKRQMLQASSIGGDVGVGNDDSSAALGDLSTFSSGRVGPISKQTASSSDNSSGTAQVSTNLVENPLRNFNVYNYIITLGMVSLADYEGGNLDDVDFTKVLIRSGGGMLDKRVKTSDEGDEVAEMFIDNLEVEALLTPNMKTINTFGTHISFDVIEPYSMGKFIEALKLGIVEMTEEAGVANADVSSFPLVIKIEFTGWDDDGSDPNVQIPRYAMPVMITEVEFSVDESGSKYSVKGIPFNEFGLGDDQLTIKTDMTISATTADELFQKISEELTERSKEDGIGNTYTIILDESFERADFDINEIVTSGNTDENVVPTVSYTANKSITAIINDVMMSSSVYRSGDITEGKYHIIHPRTSPRFDENFQRLVKDIVFVVKPYNPASTELVKSNTKPEIVDQIIPKVVKEYNYIYTGKNEDILAFDINFNTAYYKTLLSNAANLTPDQGPSALTQDSNGVTEPVNTATQHTSGTEEYSGGEESRSTTRTAVSGGNGVSDTKKRIAQEIFESITSHTVDMISAEMEIWGDPYYLPSAVGNYDLNTSTETYIDSKGRMSYTNETPCVFVNFKTPFDYPSGDGSTMEFSKIKTIGEFSGLYRVLSLVNSFSGGEFKQRLDMIRITGQNYAITGERRIGIVENKWSNIIKGILEWIRAAFEGIRDFFDDIVDAIGNPFGGLFSGQSIPNATPETVVTDQSGNQTSQADILSGSFLAPTISSSITPSTLSYRSISIKNNLGRTDITNYNSASRSVNNVFQYEQQTLNNAYSAASVFSAERPLTQPVNLQSSGLSVSRPPVR